MREEHWPRRGMGQMCEPDIQRQPRRYVQEQGYKPVKTIQ